MSDLARVGLLFGGLLVVANGFALAAPGPARKWLLAFPRVRLTAWVLTAVDLVWAGKLLYESPLGRFEALKPLIFFLTPAAVVLVAVFVDELLGPRSLGGLFLLVAAPMLAAARWHLSPLRLVVTVAAYGLVINGMFLIVCPYRFRKGVERLLSTDGQCRLWAALGCGLGALIAGLSLFVY